MTVRPRIAFDPDPCVQVALPERVDEHSAAWLELPPDRRCVHLTAADTTTWTAEGVRVIAFRIAGRPPIDLSDVPDPLRDAIETDVLSVLDWLSVA